MHPRRSVLTALLGSLVLTGCAFVMDFVAKPADVRLVDETLDRWATPGRPFMESAFGQDTVTTRTDTGDRSWVVTTDAASYALAVTRADVYPTFPGAEFGRWVSDRARALGFRTFVPQDVLGPIAEGSIVAIGDLEAQFGEATRSGRSTWERVAYLRADGDGETQWSIQPESRSANVVLNALKTVYDDMLFTDDRVMDCLGSASPGTVERSVALGCIEDVLETEYGAGPR